MRTLLQPVFRSFALSDVDADADDPVWVSFAAEGNKAARLDPSQLAARTKDTILYVIFAPVGTESLTAALFYPFYVRRGARRPGIRCALPR